MEKYKIKKTRLDENLEGKFFLETKEDNLISPTIFESDGEPYFGSWTDKIKEFENDDNIQILVEKFSLVESFFDLKKPEEVVQERINPNEDVFLCPICRNRGEERKIMKILIEWSTLPGCVNGSFLDKEEVKKKESELKRIFPQLKNKNIKEISIMVDLLLKHRRSSGPLLYAIVFLGGEL